MGDKLGHNTSGWKGEEIHVGSRQNGALGVSVEMSFGSKIALSQKVYMS